MKDDYFRWRSLLSVAAIACIFSVGFGLYFGVASVGDITFGSLIAASIGVGVFELWPTLRNIVTAALRDFTHSRAFALVCLRYDAMIQTVRRTFVGWHQRLRAAPGHAWRSCPST